MVHDVAYAMILAELLQALFAHGVILVVSSNIPPDDLYRNGVHRERFLPAIAAIKQHCEELILYEQRDYRVGRTPKLNTYLSPLNEHTAELMEKQFVFLIMRLKSRGLSPYKIVRSHILNGVRRRSGLLLIFCATCRAAN